MTADDEAARAGVPRTYFFAKSAEWRYEREWREFSETSWVRAVPFRMTGILFGLRCVQAVVTSVVKLFAARDDLNLWHVLAREEGFRLRRSPVDRAEIEAIGIRTPALLPFKCVVLPEAADL